MTTIPEALALAVSHHQGGRLEAARQIYLQILQAEPNHADALHLLGVIAHQVGQHETAVELIGKAIRVQPNAAFFHNNLGEAYQALRKLPEAVTCYRRALELMPDYAGTHNNLGNALKDRGELDAAVSCYRRALELQPNLAMAHYNLGNVWIETGDFQHAEDCFRSALRYDPRSALANYSLAKMLRKKLPEEDLAAQRRLLAGPTTAVGGDWTDAQRMLLHFGLAQVLDARGEYAAVAEHLEQANSLQSAEARRRGLAYDPQEHESLVARMIELCTPAFFERLGNFGLDSELPVFVVGLPRSGTTLVEQILAAHSRVFGAGEIKLANQTLTALAGPSGDLIEGLRRMDRQIARHVASHHLERLRALNGAALRIVDKLPDNYLFLGPLAVLLPRARFIHCRRDLRDVAVSCWITHFPEFRWASDREHIVSRFHAHQRIMEHWRKVLPSPGGSSLRVLEMDYEQTVDDLEGTARRLVAWCGLEWEPRCLEYYEATRPVGTASASQVRQPIYRTSVGRWRHYEQALGSLFARLADVT